MFASPKRQMKSSNFRVSKFMNKQKDISTTGTDSSKKDELSNKRGDNHTNSKTNSRESHRQESKNLVNSTSPITSSDNKVPVAQSGKQNQNSVETHRYSTPTASSMKLQQQSHINIHVNKSQTGITPDLSRKPKLSLSDDKEFDYSGLSVRWLKLTIALWNMIILDCRAKVIDIDSSCNFIKAMRWRIEGEVSANEFSVLFNEWIRSSEVYHTSTSFSIIERNALNTIGFHSFRQLLIKENFTKESQLDLFVSSILRDLNTKLLNQPLIVQRQSEISICNESWCNAADQLYFWLDSSGYGLIGYDELYFFITCLCIGLQDWQSIHELRDDLSLGVISAAVYQTLRDMGLTIQLCPFNESNRVDNQPFQKVSVSSYVFKRYLLKKGIDEATIFKIIQFVHSLHDKLINFSASKDASLNTMRSESIFYACYQFESFDSSFQQEMTIPRLWQYTVLASYSKNIKLIDLSSALKVSSPSSNTSSTILTPLFTFLFCDAEKYLLALLRASEESPVVSKALQDEIHDTAYRIWQAFENKQLSHYHQQQRQLRFNRDDIRENDMNYKVIYTMICRYKELQHEMYQIIISLVRNIYGETGHPNEISLIARTILPNIDQMMIELGYGDEQQQSVFEDYEDTIEESESVDKQDIKVIQPHDVVLDNITYEYANPRYAKLDPSIQKDAYEPMKFHSINKSQLRPPVNKVTAAVSINIEPEKKRTIAVNQMNSQTQSSSRRPSLIIPDVDELSANTIQTSKYSPHSNDIDIVRNKLVSELLIVTDAMKQQQIIGALKLLEDLIVRDERSVAELVHSKLRESNGIFEMPILRDSNIDSRAVFQEKSHLNNKDSKSNISHSNKRELKVELAKLNESKEPYHEDVSSYSNNTSAPSSVSYFFSKP